MTAKFFAILTNQGAAKLANAASLGTKLNLSQIAIGDANGTLPTPDPAQTKLINQKRIAPLNRLSVDPNNANQIIAEQVIPENEGGYWIREIGLYDDENVLIAIANCPETYKPQLQEGSGRTQTIRMVVVVSSTAAVTLKIDPSVVLATRQYADDLMNNHVRASNPHTQYAPLASPVFIGMPTVPDTHIGNAGQQIANTKFVHDVINDYDGILPVGSPVPWPQVAAPGGWFKCNGAEFDTVRFPRLAAAYPSGFLPDLRGEFIRGWDDARGVDPGRVILTVQGDAIRNLAGYIPCTAPAGFEQYVNGVLYGMGMPHGGGSSASQNQGYGIGLNAALAVPTAAENRPRNISFTYIVRAQ